jgi:hypothetical protein
MGTPVEDGAAARLRAAFDLYDFGLAMMRQNLRRAFVTESEAAIDQRLLDWRLRRSDAPVGDADGRVVAFPRPRP